MTEEEVQDPEVPSTQSRMWSMAALAADAAEDRPRASMMAAPRLPTVGRKTSSLNLAASSMMAAAVSSSRPLSAYHWVISARLPWVCRANKSSLMGAR